MEELTHHPYREQLGPMLHQMRRRIRRIQTLRGSARLAALMLGGLLLLAGIDYFFAPLPTFLRWLLPFAWLAASIAGAFVWLAKPLSRRLGLVRLARWLETRHPELDERVSTVLELAKHPEGTSISLLDELAVSAEGSLTAINPETEVASKRALEWAVPATLLAIVWVILFITSPGNTARHIVRALIPTSDLGNAAGRIEVRPGDIDLLEDESLTITARWLGGGRTPDLEVAIHLPDGSSYSEPMMPSDDGQVFHLGKLDQSFRYEVRSGRIASDRYSVNLRPIPRLLDPRAHLEYPAYTKWSPGNVSLGGNTPEATTAVSAIANTRFQLSGKLNTPVESARLEIDGQPVPDLHIERSADGGRITASWTRTEPGTAEARLILNHPLGRQFDALNFIVETRPDEAPQIRWLAPVEDKLKLPPHDTFSFRYEASDDVAAEIVSIEVSPVSGEPRKFPLDIPSKVERTEIPMWRGDGEQAVGAWCELWPQSRQFRVRLHCADGRPPDLKGPGVGFSEWKTITIDDGADALAQQEVLAQDSDVRESLAEAKKEVTQAREALDRQQDNVSKPEVAEHVQKELDRAAESLEKARQELEDLASRMEESVHAAEAPKVEQAAESVAEAIQNTERLPLADDPQARQQDLAQAREAARNAEQQLEKLQQEVQQRQQQIQDLAKLRDLEQQQRELARQATEELSAQPTAEQAPTPEAKWQQDQQQLAQQLGQEANQRPEARADTLQQQAEQAKDLAEQAREASAQQEQLESLAQQAQKQPADTPAQAPSPENASESLRDALAQAQQELAGQADQQLADSRQRRDPAANILPEASQSAHQAAESLGAEKPEAGQPEAGQPEAGQPEAGQPEAGQPEAGQPEAGQPEAGQPEAGQPEAGQPEAGDSAKQAAEQAHAAADALQQAAESMQGESASPESSESGEAGQPEAASPTPAEAAGDAAKAEALGDLAEQQQQLAEAIEAFAEGNQAEALRQLAELEAAEAGSLAEAISEMPQMNGPSGPMQQAGQASQAGAQQAEAAADAAEAGSMPQAATAHGSSSDSMAKAAEALEQAASEFQQQAAQAAGQPANPNLAPAPGESLADAFSEASQAASSNSPPQAADHANAAAEALSQAARQALGSMQGRGKPQPGQPQPGNQPGDKNEEGPRPEQADPGVPPELAKLGITADDWARIKSSLRAEIGANTSFEVPEEYRGLVRQYFEQMAKGGSNE